jgi:methylenetetrahydrofolate reductase (NADPH)
MDKLAIQNLVRNYSIEATIVQAQRIKRFADIVPPGTCIYIPHTPHTEFADVVTLAARLRQEGMEPVPHIVARRMRSLATLDDLLGRLATNGGVKQVLVVAGDIASPSGGLQSSLEILESGVLEKHGIRTIGVAGHPEGHRDVSDAVLRESLKRKNEYAAKTGAHVYVVTQFTFSADPVIAWEKTLGGDIGALPLMAGLPGPATAKTLLRYAMECGIGASLQAFTKRYASLSRLLTVSSPDETIIQLAAYRQQTPGTRLAGVHFFTFGGFEKTAEWANQIVAGNFLATDNGELTLGS